MTSVRHNRLDEFKVRANMLLKDLAAQDRIKNEAAAKRFLQLPFLSHADVAQVLSDIPFFRHKHALAVIAIEKGFANWASLRTNVIMEDCLFYNTSPSFLNVWFNNYADAKDYHLSNGGYLLQYRKDYIVVEKDYIHAIGLGDMEAEWNAIGYDWVKPINKKAWAIIFERAKHNYLARKTPIHTPIDKSKRPQWLTNA